MSFRCVKVFFFYLEEEARTECQEGKEFEERMESTTRKWGTVDRKIRKTLKDAFVFLGFIRCSLLVKCKS